MLSCGREWTNDNYGGKCKLKGDVLHESSELLNKCENPDSVKETEQLLSGEMNKRKKIKDCNTWDEKPNTNRITLRKDCQHSKQKEMSMQDCMKDNENKYFDEGYESDEKDAEE